MISNIYPCHLHILFDEVIASFLFYEFLVLWCLRPADGELSPLRAGQSQSWKSEHGFVCRLTAPKPTCLSPLILGSRILGYYFPALINPRPDIWQLKAVPIPEKCRRDSVSQSEVSVLVISMIFSLTLLPSWPTCIYPYGPLVYGMTSPSLCATNHPFNSSYLLLCCSQHTQIMKPTF